MRKTLIKKAKLFILVFFALLAILTINVFASSKDILTGSPFLRDPSSDYYVENGHIKIKWSAYAHTNTTYNLVTQTDSSFSVIYTVLDKENGTKDVLLEVKAFEYGAEFLVAPNDSRYIQTSVIKNKNIILIQLKNGIKEDIVIDFTMKPAPLSIATAIKWMDEGTLPATSLKVNEYINASLSGTNIVNAPNQPSNYSLNTTCSYGSMAPTNITPASDQELGLTPVYTYDMKVSSINALTNHMLGINGASSYNASGYGLNFVMSYAENNKPFLYYNFKPVHKDSAPLIEIKNIKVYAPHDKINLVGLTSVGEYTPTTSVLYIYSFYAFWDNWTISSRQHDANGYYYTLTPPSRLFNITRNNTIVDMMVGMKLIWQMDSATDELTHNETSYTTLQAANTVITYQIPNSPGDPISKELIHNGPVLNVFARGVKQNFITTFNLNRIRDLIINNNYIDDYSVTTGSSVIKQLFTSFYNTAYQYSNSDGVRTEKTPGYLGPIDEKYIFPYEIQPTAIYITVPKNAFYDLGLNAGRVTRLESINYKTSDGGNYFVAQTDIDNFNASITSTYAYESAKFKFTEAINKRVTEVRVNYSKRAVLYSWPNYIYSEGFLTRYAATTNTYFDYTVATTHENNSAINNREMSQVQYSVEAPDNTSLNIPSNVDRLWFAFKGPICPELYFEGVERAPLVSANELGNTTGNIGRLYFEIGRYGERVDDLLNPSIDLSVKFSLDSNNFQGNISGIDANTEGLAYLTGKFTAMPALSNWKFTYDTNLRSNVIYTVPVINSSSGETVQIPLNENEYFTKLKLSYDNSFSTAHTNVDDTRTALEFMKDIEMRTLRKNPFNGATITAINGPFTILKVYLNAVASWDNCVDTNHQHTATEINQGQQAKYYISGVTALVPRLEYSIYRKMGVSKVGIDKPTTVKTVYQGASFNDSFFVKITAGGLFGTFSNGLFQNDKCPYKNISEAVYIELTDPAFIPDLTKTFFFGTRADDENILSEVITKNNKKFLKLKFVDGYKRNFYNLYNQTSVSFYNGVYANFNIGNGNAQAAGPISIGFKTLPGVEIGTHYPIGNIYFDYNELLEKYNAPDFYNSEFVKYEFTNAETDALGLSSTNVSTPQMFVFDLSTYSVNIQKSVAVGSNIFSGVNGYYQLENNSITDVFNHQRESIEALYSITGATSSDLYEYTAYIPLPRKNQAVNYTDQHNNNLSVVSEFNIYLRSAPDIMTNTTGNNDITIAYTTTVNPNETSIYTTAQPTTEAGWRAVTGIKIVSRELSKESTINVKLNLITDEKEEIGDFMSYISGPVFFKTSINDPVFVPSRLPLAKYRNTDYIISTSDSLVFYDCYDENGLKNSDISFGENPVAGIRVSVYDNLNPLKVISTTTTNSDGSFVLKSYKNTAGQTLGINVPNGYRLTKKSTEAMNIALIDSDFNRSTSRLILPALTNVGIKNISAGLVRLPVISAEDVEVNVGENVNVTATLTDYLGVDLPENAYNITFNSAASSIATVAIKTSVLSGNEASYQDTTAITGLMPGTTTATISTSNTLGDIVTKTYNITVKNVSINRQYTINWVDDSNVLNLRPSFINLQLWRKSSRTADVRVGSSINVFAPSIFNNQWTHTFTNLNKYDVYGEAYEYYLTQNNVDKNYQVSYQMSQNQITNAFKGINISGKKIWAENSGGFVRPINLTINLYRSDNLSTPYRSVIIDNNNVDASDPNIWNYSFINVPEFNASGVKYTYTVDEDSVPSGYMSLVSGYDITNSYDVETFNFDLTWVYNGAPVNQRPNAVNVKLYRDDNLIIPYRAFDLTSAGGWKSSIGILKTETANHAFRVVADNVANYITTYSASTFTSNNLNISLTNTYIQKASPNTGDSSPVASAIATATGAIILLLVIFYASKKNKR